MVSFVARGAAGIDVSIKLVAFSGLWPAYSQPRVEIRLAVWDDTNRRLDHSTVTQLLYPPELKRYLYVVVCNQFFPHRVVISRNMALCEILGGSSVEHVYVAPISVGHATLFRRAVVKRCVTTLLKEADRVGRIASLELAQAVYNFTESADEHDDNVIALRNILMLSQT